MGYASYYEDNIDARGESKRSKSRKPKVSNRREPLKKQYVPEDDICFESLLDNLLEPSLPTPKDDIGTRGQSKQPKTLRPKPSPKTRQRSCQNVPVVKTRYVPPDEIQQRIELEIIRQDKESKGIYPN